jgi:hypothetical protein
MPAQQLPTRDVGNPRTKVVGTILLIMLAGMIIMDIFARRRAATARSLPAGFPIRRAIAEGCRTPSIQD